MSNTFDYEFIFPTGVFEQSEYDKCPITDEVGGRQQVIEGVVAEVQNILNNMAALNLNVFSTYTQHNNVNYKVTVHNPNYKQ